MDYPRIFHSLHREREKLRGAPVAVVGVGATEKHAVEALRALGIAPAFATAVQEGPETFCGLPVKALARTKPEDVAGKLLVAAHSSMETLVPQLAALWGVERGAFVETYRNPAPAPAQELAPMPEPLRTSPKALETFMARRKKWRERRYAAIRAISRWAFYAYFVLGGAGWQYGVRRRDKWGLLRRAFRNAPHFKSLTTPAQQLWLCHELFKVSVKARGDVVECGCYDGASTAILSTACKLVGRKLYVCDSFEGLPEPEADEKLTIRTGKTFYHWKEGEFASPGGVEGVRQRVERFGTVEACEFVKGFFCDTLPDLPVDSAVLVFEDADLKSSVVDCLKYLWPRLRSGCKFFSHEPWSIDVVSLFFDHGFWKANFGCPPPGFYGGDMGGIRAMLAYFKMGFAVKRDFDKIVKKGERVMISGSL